MQRKTTDEYGSFGLQYISIVAVLTGGLFILYYLIYLLFRLIFPPLLSILFATSLTAIAFFCILIIRYLNGPFFNYEVTDEPSFPDIPEPTEPVEQSEAPEQTKPEQTKPEQTEPEDSHPTLFSKDHTIDDITEDDIPKELYVRVVKDNTYTLEDAKRDTIKQQETKDED